MRDEREIAEALGLLLKMKTEYPSGKVNDVLHERACALAWALGHKSPQKVVPDKERLKFLACF